MLYIGSSLSPQTPFGLVMDLLLFSSHLDVYCVFLGRS